MNKIPILFFILTIWNNATAQLTLNPYNTGYIALHSYAGATQPGLIRVQIGSIGTMQMDIDKWSLTFKAGGEFKNYENKIFPSDKINLKISEVVGTRKNRVNVYPTISNIGFITTALPLLSVNSFLIPQSNYFLRMPNSKYFDMVLVYDVSIEGGAYLQNYASWQTYGGFINMEIRDKDGEVVASKDVYISFMIHPDDSPPVEPSFELILSTEAKNVLLEFKTPNDYANGVSKTLLNALSVTSNAGYQVSVSSLNGDLVTASNQTLPVNAIKLLTTESVSQTQLSNISLSQVNQNIATGVATGSSAKKYDLKFFTSPGDTRFFNKSSEQYSGTIIFSLTPQ